MNIETAKPNRFYWELWKNRIPFTRYYIFNFRKFVVAHHMFSWFRIGPEIFTPVTYAHKWILAKTDPYDDSEITEKK